MDCESNVGVWRADFPKRGTVRAHHEGTEAVVS